MSTARLDNKCIIDDSNKNCSIRSSTTLLSDYLFSFYLWFLSINYKARFIAASFPKQISVEPCWSETIYIIHFLNLLLNTEEDDRMYQINFH